MKGIFNKRPNLPKNNVTWNPEVLLKYIKTLAPNQKLSLLDLTIKTVALMLLLTGQRGQSLFLLDIRNITITPQEVKLNLEISLRVVGLATNNKKL